MASLFSIGFPRRMRQSDRRRVNPNLVAHLTAAALDGNKSQNHEL
jgi:hypothetical protein